MYSGPIGPGPSPGNLMKMIRNALSICVLALLVFTTLPTLAQDGEEPKDGGKADKAQRLLFSRNYSAALSEYLKLLEDDPENTRFNYNIGVCYINSDFEKMKAIPHLEKVLYYDKYIVNAYYLMGRAYHFNHQFDEAIEMYTKFGYLADPSEARSVQIDKQIEYCENAIQLKRFPIASKFENLGPTVNSEFPDYYPFIPVDESFIMFNSRRDDGSAKSGNGLFKSNVYISEVKDGEFGPAKPLPENINTPQGNESIVGLSAQGDIVLFNLDNKEFSSSDLYLSNKIGDEITPPRILDETINSKNGEIAASISEDGRAIYFASTRRDGYGGSDIYVSRLLPTGAWGVPENLGPSVNTDQDEDFPNISPDGKTLYFSSKGHLSMGGFDIFKASIDKETGKFNIARNLGYPINDVGDDVNFRVSKSGRYGYIAAVRPEGLGDFDLYRVTFEAVETELSVLKGFIKSANEGQRKAEDVIITITHKDTDELEGTFIPNPRTMRYVVILAPGEYTMLVESPGFKPLEKDITVLGKSSFQAEIDGEITLEIE